jgi:SAM-dependent methyltransferase
MRPIDEPWDEDTTPILLYLQSLAIRAEIDKLCIKTDADILYIGASEPALIKEIIKRAPDGTLLGIDDDEALIAPCREALANNDNCQIKHMDPYQIDFENQFDFICSFFYKPFLIDPVKIYEAIFKALRPDGQMLIISPSKRGPMMASFLILKESGEIPELNDYEMSFNIKTYEEIEETLSRIPFASFKIGTPLKTLTLPNLKTFRDFLESISFLFAPDLSDSLIAKMFDAQTRIFDKICQQNYDGEYIFQSHPFIISATK